MVFVLAVLEIPQILTNIGKVRQAFFRYPHPKRHEQYID